MAEFDQRVAWLEAIGFNFNREYEYRGKGEERERVTLNLFTHVGFGFTPEDWVRIASREGSHYIGGCCGNTSAIQDTINHWFRFEYDHVPVDELAEVAEGMIHHDGIDESPFSVLPFKATDLLDMITKFQEGIASGKAVDPWVRITMAWHLVKEFRTEKVPSATRRDYSELDRALSTVGRIARALNFHKMFNDDHNYPIKDEAEVAARIQALVRFAPAIKTIATKFAELDPGGFEGWALIDIEKGEDAISENGYGLCIYQKLETVKAMVDLLRANEDEYEESRLSPVAERLGMRKVKVDYQLEDGFEFIGELEQLP
jgi:hypothetical protein